MKNDTLGAQNVGGGGIGQEICAGRKYTPLYEKGIKKVKNKSMETAEFDNKLYLNHQIIKVY